MKTLQQPRSSAGAQFALTGPHSDAGAAAEIEQAVDRQVLHRVLHLTGRHGFALAHQAAAQSSFTKPRWRSVAVAVYRGPAQRRGQGDDFLQRFFGGLTRSRQRLFCRDARLGISELAADGIGRPLGHQAIGHQLAAGDGDKPVHAVARGVIEQHDAPADVPSARVVVVGDQRTHARVGAQNPRLGHHRGQFFPFPQQDIYLFSGDAVVINLAVVHVR